MATAALMKRAPRLLILPAMYAGENGALVWERHYDGPGHGFDSPRAVMADRHGDVFVTGSSFNGESSDFYTVKYARANGAVLWEKLTTGRAMAMTTQWRPHSSCHELTAVCNL
jgi:outer membrane protein assembly factor BamB